MNRTTKILVSIARPLITVLVSSLLVALPVQWLWNNCLVGAVNGINPIGFWQSVGIFALFTILFKDISKRKKDEN